MLRNAGPITKTPESAKSTSSLPSLNPSSTRDGDDELLVRSSVFSSAEDIGAVSVPLPTPESLTIWASESVTGGNITGELHSREDTVEFGYEIATPARVQARPGGLTLKPILPSNLRRYEHRVMSCVLKCII